MYKAAIGLRFKQSALLARQHELDKCSNFHPITPQSLKHPKALLPCWSSCLLVGYPSANPERHQNHRNDSPF